MMNFDDLSLEYRDLIGQYESNDCAIGEFQATIMDLVKTRSEVVEILLDEMLERQNSMTEAKMKLLQANFSMEDIQHLSMQYLEKYHQ